MQLIVPHGCDVKLRLSDQKFTIKCILKFLNHLTDTGTAVRWSRENNKYFVYVKHEMLLLSSAVVFSIDVSVESVLDIDMVGPSVLSSGIIVSKLVLSKSNGFHTQFDL